jgi:hypothetical protein
MNGRYIRSRNGLWRAYMRSIKIDKLRSAVVKQLDDDEEY